MRKRFVDSFFPGRPVDDPARFSGRDEQVDEVVDALFQLRSGRPRNCIITGDRGIGKSSLLLQAKLLAEGNNALPDRLGLDTGVEAFDFAVGWHDADPGQGPRELVEGLLSDFQTRSGKLLAKIKIEVSIGSVLTVSAKEGTSSLSSLVRKFCEQVAKLEELVDRREKDGVIFFIDELDRAAADRGVATFFKLATERLNRDGIHHVGFMGAGITGAVQALEAEHGSIFRTLRDITLPRLTKAETEDILISGFEAAGFDYEKGVGARVFAVSGGFPEPVHMLGSEMLSVDSDGRITSHDFEAAKTKVITDVRRNKLHSILGSVPIFL